MKAVITRRAGTARGLHVRGIMLVALAVMLAVATVYFLEEWGKGPGDPGNLLAQLLGSGPRMEVSTVTTGDQPNGPPRSRTGLVATSDNQGQVLFGRYCDSCHTGAREFTGPSLRSPAFKSEGMTVEKIVSLARKGGFDMPAFPDTMVSDEDLQQIAGYVLSLPVDKP